MLRSMILHHGSFLIRKSVDIMLICSSPRLIAACHVLLRLLMPRHSPYALVRLNFLYIVPILWFSLNCLSFFEHFSFRIIDSLTHEKTFFAFCTCYLSIPPFGEIVCTLSCAIPFSFGKTNISLKIICPLLFVFYSKYFLLFDCQRSFGILMDPRKFCVSKILPNSL